MNRKMQTMYFMLKPICRDPLFPAQRSAPVTPTDADAARTARDLLETLTASRERAVKKTGIDKTQKGLLQNAP